LLLSLALNALLITGLVYTLQKAQHYYQEYRLFRPQAHGISNASTFELPQARPQTLMVLYGDSRIQEWKPLPKLNNTLVVNAGVAGETALEVRRRLQQDVLRLAPDIVLLQPGMNDLTVAATRGVDKPEQFISDMKSNIEFIVDELLSQNTEVILTPVIPAKSFNTGRKLFWYTELHQLVADTNVYLKALAKKHSLQWIDLNALLHDADGKLKEEWYFDTLHLHTARYGELNKLVEAALNDN